MVTTTTHQRPCAARAAPDLAPTRDREEAQLHRIPGGRPLIRGRVVIVLRAGRGFRDYQAPGQRQGDGRRVFKPDLATWFQAVTTDAESAWLPGALTGKGRRHSAGVGITVVFRRPTAERSAEPVYSPPASTPAAMPQAAERRPQAMTSTSRYLGILATGIPDQMILCQDFDLSAEYPEDGQGAVPSPTPLAEGNQFKTSTLLALLRLRPVKAFFRPSRGDWPLLWRRPRR